MFVRAQLSAQAATFVDFLLSIFLHQWCGIYYVYATLYGSITGGLVNCVLNYKWTFHTDDCRPANVLVKYLLVWAGSIGLNLWGTYLLTEILTSPTGYFVLSEPIAFISSKITIAVLVAVFWNYQLHRVFVFKDAQLKRLLRKKLIKLKLQYGNQETSQEDARRTSATHLQDHTAAHLRHDQSRHHA